MNLNAAPQASLKTQFLLAALAVAAVLLTCFAAFASAAVSIGKDGQIHACYRVKGKPKGSLRVVPSAKKRCRRGERKVTWSVAGSPGQAGANGQSTGGGQQGQAGANGSSGANGASGGGEAALVSKVASLALKVESLEGLLNGVENGDLQEVMGTLNGIDNVELSDTVDAVKGLTNVDLSKAVDAVEGLSHGELAGAVDAVQGLDNTQLTEAVDSLPTVDLLCTQGASLTEQVNKVGAGVGEISLLGAGAIPGLGIKLPTLTPLQPFSC
jgi:hypothetical protein